MMRIIFSLMDSDGDGTISLQEFQAGSRADLQGNGCQQRWPPDSGGDASLHAGNQEIGSAALGPYAAPTI